MDLKEKEGRLRAKLEAGLQKQIENLGKEYGSEVNDQVIKRMQDGIEEALKKVTNAFQTILSGPSKKQQPVKPTTFKFTRDGKWLCCAAGQGFFVYSWPDAIGHAGEVLPTPVWHHAIGPGESRIPTDYIYDMVQEVDGTGILFGGHNGQIFHMDLETGKTRLLFTMPQEASIIQLIMSRDGQALGIISRPSMRDHKNLNNQTAYWSIWSYPKMLAAADARSNEPLDPVL